MSISALRVANFKGLDEDQWVRLRPLTIFIGPNSSGKSSCIHALAALAQTVKLAADPRPLVLDDEFAQVHLGRFIEVIHSKSYSDAILLGISLGEIDFVAFDENLDRVRSKGIGSAAYSFKSTKRTQETYLDTAQLNLGDLSYSVKRSGDRYELTNAETGKRIRAAREAGLNFEWNSALVGERDVRSALRIFNPLIYLQREITAELRKVLYLGPFRQAPLRRYPSRGSTPTEVGAQGEATITLLANEVVQSRSRTHMKQLARWLKMMGLGRDLDVRRVGSSDLFDVNLTLDDGASLPIADLGYGLSQVLPVLAQCSFAPESATLLFEQPELHLHQLGARPLARVFIETIKNTRSSIVVETHSPDMLLQIIRELRDGNLDLADVALYRVRREGGRTVVDEIEVDPNTFDIYTTWQAGLTMDI